MSIVKQNFLFKWNANYKLNCVDSIKRKEKKNKEKKKKKRLKETITDKNTLIVRKAVLLEN